MYYIDNIYWLVEDCKRYGTLPFAGLARSAFIAKDILLSFVNEKILNQQEVEIFLSNIRTVSSDIYKNSYTLSKRKFLDLIFFFIRKILFAIDVSEPVLTISRLRFLKELLFLKYFSIK